jgi:hypothetical protein
VANVAAGDWGGFHFMDAGEGLAVFGSGDELVKVGGVGTLFEFLDEFHDFINWVVDFKVAFKDFVSWFGGAVVSN